MVVGDVSDVCVIHDRNKDILQTISDIKEGSQERYRAAQLALGKKNREPRTEPKEPGTGTEKIGSCSVPNSWEPNYPGSFGSVLGYPKNRGNSTSTHIA
jgi:hypothetical protein